MSVAKRADGNTAPSTRQPPPYTSSGYVPPPNSPSRSAGNSSPSMTVNHNIRQPTPQRPTAPLDNSKRPPPPQRPVQEDSSLQIKTQEVYI